VTKAKKRTVVERVRKAAGISMLAQKLSRLEPDPTSAKKKKKKKKKKKGRK
jgi:hypothetical protein